MARYNKKSNIGKNGNLSKADSTQSTSDPKNPTAVKINESSTQGPVSTLPSYLLDDSNVSQLRAQASEIDSEYTEGPHIMVYDNITESNFDADSLLGSLAGNSRFPSVHSQMSDIENAPSIIEAISLHGEGNPFKYENELSFMSASEFDFGIGGIESSTRLNSPEALNFRPTSIDMDEGTPYFGFFSGNINAKVSKNNGSRARETKEKLNIPSYPNLKTRYNRYQKGREEDLNEEEIKISPLRALTLSESPIKAQDSEHENKATLSKNEGTPRRSSRLQDMDSPKNLNINSTFKNVKRKIQPPNTKNSTYGSSRKEPVKKVKKEVKETAKDMTEKAEHFKEIDELELSEESF